jgi:hypothetical protein
VKRKPVEKQPIDPQRVRRVPAQGFSWIDRRFVRDGFIEHLPPEAILLYFFLAAVSDARGISFYADPTISKILKLGPEELSQSRARLVDAELILYRYPLYQVLSLPPKRTGPAFRSPSPARCRRGGDPVPLSEILQTAMKNARSSENGCCDHEEKA